MTLLCQYRSCLSDLCWSSAPAELPWQDHHGHQRWPSALWQNTTKQGSRVERAQYWLTRRKRCFFSSWICPESYLQVMNVETESILLRRMEFFLQYDIEVWLRKEVSLFLLISIITINWLYDVRFSNRFCFRDLWFHVCRHCQWTQMRKLSHLMMVRSRVMISCSSPRAAGTDFWDLD